MSDSVDHTFEILGTVEPGFESVRTLYEHNMRTLQERQTQLCVYYQGEKVVDLWAAAEDHPNFSPDSLINVFSSGKSLEAIAMASLVGKGLLKYDARITEYWPEFGASGKQTLTVAELMRHEAGLAAFDTSIEPEDLLTENIKVNKIGRIIEPHGQKFRADGGSTREYHAVTRGWIVNEVFRRVDPKGRTIGEFLRQDIRDPLGVDVNIGVEKDDLHRVVRVSPLKFGFQFLESLKPKLLGRKMEHNIFQTAGRVLRLIPAMRKGTTKGTPPPYKGMNRIAFFNEPKVVMGETPSANANCSARGLAKLAAVVSLGGQWEGVEYLSEDAWKALHGNPDTKDMGFGTTTFTQGGVAKFAETSQSSTKRERDFNEGREGFFGWMGLGGSLFQWHPEHQIGFGYVPTSLNVLDLYNERGKTYQAEVLKCVKALNA
jgi:CubicO group peptidase (beta-lactamase class C family)